MGEGSLETPRLELRPARPDDLPWILAEVNTPAMMRHLGGVRSDDDVRDSLDHDIAAFFAPGGHQRWTAFRKHDGARVARAGLFHVRSAAAPEGLRGQREVGWMVAERHWRQGYAIETATAVFDHAFGLGFARVFAQTSDWNAGSTRVMQRLGLERRAELDYADPDYPPEDNPTTVWAIDAKAWRARNG